MAEREARPSTDQESAPLLSDPEGHPNAGQDSSIYQRVNSVAQEPLTPLTKILLILALFLLLTSSVFIGLFAGAQHRISQGGDTGKTTVIVTVTATTTVVSTSQSVSTATSTSTQTTTIVPPAPTSTTVPQPPKCIEPHCIVLSASILSSLDTTQDPCENFYDFANGGWLSQHPLPADKSSFGQFEALAQQNVHVIQNILESKTKIGGVDDDILNKLRNFYASCMDEKALDDLGSAPLLHVVKTIRNLYRSDDTDITSTSEKSNKKQVDGLTAAVAFLHTRGIGALFSFDIEGDIGVDPNRMVLWFNQPELTLPSKEYYEDEGVVALLRDIVERLLLAVDQSDDIPTQSHKHDMPAVLANNEDANVWPPWPWPPWGGDDDDDKPLNRTQRIHKLAKGVVEFEQKLARASLDLDILYQDPVATYNPVQLSNLTETITQIKFPTYFSTFTPRAFPERVILTHPPYSKSLYEILNATHSDVIESYLVARAGFTLSPFLSMQTDAWKAQRSLLEALTGIKKGAIGDRSEYCVERVEETLGFAAGRYFVNATFGGDSKEKGTKVITGKVTNGFISGVRSLTQKPDIVKAFKHSLEHVDWMDEKSARAAAEKADAIRIKVGYPLSPDTGNPNAIARYYSGVQADKKDFFGNMLSSATSDIFKKWLQLGRNRDLDAWEMFPSTVNAYFNPPANEIVFPAGILQSPFFSQDWPGYLSYGAFGHVASHELTHAFDSAGRLYNQQGKLAQWWTNTTSEGFKIKQKCIVDQYSAYYIDDGKGGRIHVNGNLTSGENIGDTGLIQAYRAWKAQFKDSEKAGNEYLLPGLDFTREQLFFLSFARIWARAMKPAAAVQRIRTDPHSPSRFRVDGTVSNIPEFAQAFKCSKKAKLNPPNEKRCIFWGS